MRGPTPAEEAFDCTMSALADPLLSEADFRSVFEAGVQLPDGSVKSTIESIGVYVRMWRREAGAVVAEMIRRGYDCDVPYSTEHKGLVTTRTLLSDVVLDGNAALVATLIASGANPDHRAYQSRDGVIVVQGLTPFEIARDNTVEEKQEKLAILQSWRTRRLIGDLTDQSLHAAPLA